MTETVAYRIALELIVQRFAELFDAAKAEIPTLARNEIEALLSYNASLMRQNKGLVAEIEEMKKELATVRTLADAALRWRANHFSPALEGAVDAYEKACVQRPR